jgi:hypothetical protein
VLYTVVLQVWRVGFWRFGALLLTALRCIVWLVCVWYRQLAEGEHRDPGEVSSLRPVWPGWREGLQIPCALLQLRWCGRAFRGHRGHHCRGQAGWGVTGHTSHATGTNLRPCNTNTYGPNPNILYSTGKVQKCIHSLLYCQPLWIRASAKWLKCQIYTCNTNHPVHPAFRSMHLYLKLGFCLMCNPLLISLPGF